MTAAGFFVLFVVAGVTVVPIIGTPMTASHVPGVMAAEQQQHHHQQDNHNSNKNKEWYHHNGYSSSSNVHDGNYFGDTTREQVLETRRRRKRQLRMIVDTSRQKLADHSSGQISLSPKEKQQLEDQMDIFQRKLDVWKDELEDWVRCCSNVPRHLKGIWSFHTELGGFVGK